MYLITFQIRSLLKAVKAKTFIKIKNNQLQLKNLLVLPKIQCSSIGKVETASIESKADLENTRYFLSYKVAKILMSKKIENLCYASIERLEQWFLNWGAQKIYKGNVRDDKLSSSSVNSLFKC